MLVIVHRASVGLKFIKFNNYLGTEAEIILIVNEKEDIPITGVADSSNHNWIIYVLAAVAGIAALGAGIFLWKKKDEFVGE